MVACTQPRRLATVSIVTRVAEEMGVTVIVFVCYKSCLSFRLATKLDTLSAPPTKLMPLRFVWLS